MPAAPDKNSERPQPLPYARSADRLPYARSADRPWTLFQVGVATACAVALLVLGVSTAELLYHVPGGARYLFGQRTDIGYLGLLSAILSPIIFVLSCFAQRFVLISAAACLVALAIIWTVRMFVLLSHL
jgi:hypothetical protein